MDLVRLAVRAFGGDNQVAELVHLADALALGVDQQAHPGAGTVFVIRDLDFLPVNHQRGTEHEAVHDAAVSCESIVRRPLENVEIAFLINDQRIIIPERLFRADQHAVPVNDAFPAAGIPVSVDGDDCLDVDRFLDRAGFAGNERPQLTGMRDLDPGEIYLGFINDPALDLYINGAVPVLNGSAGCLVIYETVFLRRIRRGEILLGTGQGQQRFRIRVGQVNRRVNRQVDTFRTGIGQRGGHNERNDEQQQNQCDQPQQGTILFHESLRRKPIIYSRRSCC